MDVAALILGLASASAAERSVAAERLAHLEADARPAAVALVLATADQDERVREWAVAALEGLGTPEPEQVPQIAALLDGEPAVGYWAATLLGRASVAGDLAVASLAEVVERNPHAEVRQRAAWALGKMGPAAAAALPALQRAAASDDARLARLAGKAAREVAQPARP